MLRMIHTHVHYSSKNAEYLHVMQHVSAKHAQGALSCFAAGIQVAPAAKQRGNP